MNNKDLIAQKQAEIERLQAEIEGLKNPKIEFKYMERYANLDLNYGMVMEPIYRGDKIDHQRLKMHNAFKLSEREVAEEINSFFGG